MVLSGHGETRDLQAITHSQSRVQYTHRRDSREAVYKRRSGRVSLGSLGLGPEVGRGTTANEEAADQRGQEGVEDDLSAAVLYQWC